MLTEHTLNMNAYSLRTMQFVEGLKDLDAKIFLLDKKENYSNGEFPEIEGVIFFEDFKDCKKAIRKLNLDVLISVNNYTSYLACKIPGEFYRICDLNGTFAYELQAQCFWEQNDLRYLILKHRQKKILKKADLITTVSLAQKNSVIGQLSLVGGSGYKNLSKNLVEVIENSQTKSFDSCYNKEKFNLDTPTNSQKLLFLGSFNNWVDEESLIESFSLAKVKNPNLILILTGRKNSEFGNGKYENFMKIAKKKKLTNSIFHLGFIDYLDMKSLIEFCDLGIVCDLKIYESQLGARNRINEMLKFGLPVLCTKASQISNVLFELNENFGAESGNIQELADKINWMLDKKNQAEIKKTVGAFNKKYVNNLKHLDCIKNFIKNPFKKDKMCFKPFKFLKFVIKKRR